MTRNVGRPPTRITQRLEGDWEDAAERVETQLKQLDARETSRYNAGGFFVDNLPANQTDVPLSRYAPTGSALLPTAHIVCRPGSVTAFWVRISAAPASGTATFKVFKNGSLFSLGTLSVTSSSPLFQVISLPAGQAPFAAGDYLEVVCTTASLSPTTIDARAGIELSDS